ncbi:mycofactocin-coupled SDR family oxidoreductase [Mycolicibacterium brisbanense]|uniref:Short-chain dehydrogenase/reductase SDR n=1 Tax=Mycolicibacterium brisbanense TaxID=146020 RepID=A0A117I6E1_9MYCO|nr:mycofactocin-coupled SDR family oxidoreductase [Mycolicibacterium brisbanense]MCV7159954.1 mycofactocin-coupled SDR family oxidoreductase [Mycolicibacterium brisbanense]GAS89870.1 short-chain dehydrogenase/reductase SDR [Mycolicibacterium brisbanense]
MTHREGRLARKVAFITGAARGIGRAQAVRFAEEGAAVIAVDLCGPIATVGVPPATPVDLADTARLVRAVGGRISTAIVDVRDVDGLAAVVDTGVAEFGGLDIVCATAGITSRAAMAEMDEQTWQTMLDVNLTGVFHTCKVTAPQLIARGAGSIVLVSSIAGHRGLVGVGHYTAAKHGIVGLMRSLAHELAPHAIRVNTVHPTNVDTPLIQNDMVRSGFRPDLDRVPTRTEFAQAARTMNLLDIPWVEPHDVANASLFLASDEARYITAAALPVDGGSTQR